MESLDSASLRRPQNGGPSDRSVSEGVVVCLFLVLACRVQSNGKQQSSRGRGFGPGRQNTFRDHAHAPHHMPPPRHVSTAVLSAVYRNIG